MMPMPAAYPVSTVMDRSVPREPRLLELLAAAAADMLDATDLGQMLDRLFAMLRHEFGLDAFFLYRADPEHGLVLQAHGGILTEDAEAAAVLRIGQAICGRVARDRVPIIMGELLRSTDPEHAFLQRLGISAYACTPLVHRGTLLGTLGFGRGAPERFDESEVRFLQTICSYVALAKNRIATEQALRERIDERDRMLADHRAMERKVIELTRVSALGAIASTIAHELNQPLSAAANFLSAARLAPDADAARGAELTRAAEIQLLRAGEIIRRIRRMISREDMIHEPEDLAPIIDEAVALVRAGIGGRLPHFHTTIASDARFAVVDRIQIVQILANLLRHAVELSPDTTGGCITIATHRRDDDVEITVSDRDTHSDPALGRSAHPPGRNPAPRPDPADTQDAAALELAISRTLVEAHGGTIHHEPEPGGSGTMSFTVRAVLA